MRKLKYLLLTVLIAFITSLSFDTFVMSSFWLAPNPQYAFTLGGATTSDNFIFGKPDEEIIVVEIEGILLSGTSVTGTIEECDPAGAPCNTIQADMLFDGGLDTYPSIGYTITADSTIKWTTVNSITPGYLFVTLRYYPTGQ